jgi:UDP:flavonoid glycosyltransferase YjiC (YdhE family)
VLWITSDQPIWAAQVKQLKVGAGRSFSRTSQARLTADLRGILDPSYALRAREIAARMTPPDVSVRAAADLLEKARLKRATAAG